MLNFKDLDKSIRFSVHVTPTSSFHCVRQFNVNIKRMSLDIFSLDTYITTQADYSSEILTNYNYNDQDL